ncbi:DUF6461 domain-containing protein [Actinoplanes sp. GCM10030250]|uniref:DUF6461 domain-containing protein n=1 Tax=Actinoplanes sp. GCM10030250 TaxID=3273376 RepID=UPI003607F83E
MKRRSALVLVLAGLAGCASPRGDVPVPVPAPSTAPSPGDLLWPVREAALGAGFCFTLVQGLIPSEVAGRLGGEELERVEWLRLVAGGDGERGGPGRYFIGVARIGGWSLIVEDNGSLGVTQKAVSPLSEGGVVLAYRGEAEGGGRLLVVRDGDLDLDYDFRQPDRWGGLRPGDYLPEMRAAGVIGGTAVTQPTGPALAFLAARSGVALTRELVTGRTYLLVTVPKV